jgi:hypothetical protein
MICNHRQLFKVTCRVGTVEHVFLVTSNSERDAVWDAKDARPDLKDGAWGAIVAQDEVVLLYTLNQATGEMSEHRALPASRRDGAGTWYCIDPVDALRAAAALEAEAAENTKAGAPEDDDDDVTLRARRTCREIAMALERVVAVLRRRGK